MSLSHTENQVCIHLKKNLILNPKVKGQRKREDVDAELNFFFLANQEIFNKKFA